MNPFHVLGDKLMSPSLPVANVARQEICPRICRSTAAVTVIQAAAGYGKSTVMAQARLALTNQGVSTMWLTLDRADNDAARLWLVLTKAVELALDQPLDGISKLLDALSNERGPWALFLDEAEHLQALASLGVLRAVIEQLPRNGRVIIASRVALDLGLDRLRARQALLEIHERDLRFTLAETNAYMNASVSRRLDGPLVLRLHELTEGWAAALAMSSQALERGVQAESLAEGLSGSQRDVGRYLEEEVFAGQSPELREFLLRTSVLKQLEPGLCQSLNPRMNGSRILARLVDTGVFISPLDSEVPAWRYHRMFAEFLRARLARDMPGEALRLHLLAAAWYDAQTRPAPAIDHAIAGEDWPMAAAMLERSAEAFLEQGRFRLLARWCRLLSETALADRPVIQAARLWAVVMTKGVASTRELMEQYRVDACEHPGLQAHVRVLRPLMLAMVDQHELAYAACEQALQQYAGGSPFLDGVLGNLLAHVGFIVGRQSFAADAFTRMGPIGDFEGTYRDSILCMAELRDGRLRQATARLNLGTQGAHRLPGHANAWIGTLAAYVRYEAGQFNDADQLLSLVLPTASEAGLPDLMISGYVIRSRIAGIRGNKEDALRWLCELEHDGARRGLPRASASASLERARLLLLEGQVNAAEEALERSDALFDWASLRKLSLLVHDVEDLVLGRIRLHLVAGDLELARTLIAEELGSHRTSPLRRLRVHAMEALLLWSEGRADESVKQISALLKTCAREGYVQLFADEGPFMLPLLRRCHAGLKNGSRAERDPIIQDHVERIFTALDASHEPALGGSAASASDPLTGALTSREVAVLQLLAEGCSNLDIGKRLAISENTVRTHLRSLSRKLGSTSRAQTVAFSRNSGLIK